MNTNTTTDDDTDTQTSNITCDNEEDVEDNEQTIYNTFINEILTNYNDPTNSNTYNYNDTAESDNHNNNNSNNTNTYNNNSTTESDNNITNEMTNNQDAKEKNNNDNQNNNDEDIRQTGNKNNNNKFIIVRPYNRQLNSFYEEIITTLILHGFIQNHNDILQAYTINKPLHRILFNTPTKHINTHPYLHIQHRNNNHR
ncbi:hypothetical protein HELRODRAFT_171478 [Helobdella robusta]|uniref:Uncharacterized protein n=1 Tax=Helobdella robusta TaxID=6412 RepID=T1F4C3_HELRO|nr:hypothetical protein HELRODRAFT_171478 [Helobdella robusta]ESO05804.1 hypothetical protein HELRODRAFT_171478 [Helobdella robusta]